MKYVENIKIVSKCSLARSVPFRSKGLCSKEKNKQVSKQVSKYFGLAEIFLPVLENIDRFSTNFPPEMCSTILIKAWFQVSETSLSPSSVIPLCIREISLFHNIPLCVRKGLTVRQ